MRCAWVLVFLLCLAGRVYGQSATADLKASCNASFHEGCKSAQTTTVSSSGFAAPAGALGSSGLESAFIAFLFSAAIGGRLYRRRR